MSRSDRSPQAGKVPAAKKERSYRSPARTGPEVSKALKRLGKRVRQLRLDSKLTQEQVAEAAHLDPKHLQLIESGRTNATVASLVGLARALAVRLGDLFADG